MTADDLFNVQAQHMGYNLDGEIKIGGNYVPWVRDGHLLYLSGQIPRVDDTVVVTGAAGDAVMLEQAQHAAKVCTMRALALIKKALGSLSQVHSVPRITVYVQSAESFTQQSEVADGASNLLFAVLGPEAGAHTRTSVGVKQLPKNATVEIDFIVSVKPD
jgi:enamine deaminase RidA (YjgF/YER057c/UK114 family)